MRAPRFEEHRRIAAHDVRVGQQQLAGDEKPAAEAVRGLDGHHGGHRSAHQLLDRQQSALAARIRRAIPGAYVHWRYGITIDAIAVVVPRDAVGTLERLTGIAKVWPTATYHPSLDRTPQLIGAPSLWGPTLSTAGQEIRNASACSALS